MNSTDLDFFELYLTDFLQSDFPELLRKLSSSEIKTLLTVRASNATTAFENARREGLTVMAAQEVAIHSLVKGLDFSIYNFLHDTLEKEFKQIFETLTQQQRLVPILLSFCAPLNDFILQYEIDDTPTKQIRYSLIVNTLSQALAKVV
ncbi:hypothetical protein FHS57_006379 [Runella defluvii]|uniref:DUF1896 domain-containing protein n=1 Tax=Runella defluvii TaxID=370973 RepID=A0A7W5ZSK1_9BACT|nr:DUF1896 family protein [Runella defluvii]MBB3842348.1 hypothetical protein [Runella defluvii]